MHRIFTTLGLIAVAAALPLSAQEVFELPVELDMPAAPVVFNLDNASLEVVLDAEAPSVLRARGPAGKDVSSAALDVASESGTIIIRRARGEGEEHDGAHGGAPVQGPRLRLELVLGREHRLEVAGSDLDIVVEAVPVVETGEEDDDEEENDDEEDDDEGDDDEGDEDEGDEDEEAEARVGMPVATAPEHNLSLEVTASSVNLVGVENARVNAVGSYVHGSGTRGKLTVVLEGGTAELEGHRGVFDLTSRDGEVSLADVEGRLAAAVSGGSLLIRGGVGQFDSRLDEALLRLDGWRGAVKIEGSGATVEARSLAGTRMEVRGTGHQVTIDELQGFLVADLDGGGLTATQLRGQAQITARDSANIAIDGIEGQPTLSLENSAARVSEVSGQLTAKIRDGRLEVDGARQLELVTTASEVVVARLKHLGRCEATDSQLDLDLWELRGNPTLTLKGSTEARVRLRTPCSVKLGETQLLGGGSDVTGCELHSQTFRRTRFDRQGLDGQRRVLLSATLEEGSTLEVEGIP